MLGTVLVEECGRPSNVYGSWRPRAMDHEVLLSRELTRWPIEFTKWKRGINTDSKLRPDAELPGLFVEYDCNTESRRQVVRQAVRYRNRPERIVWVFQTMARFDWLKDVADHRNTLVKLAGADCVYDLTGRETTVMKLCANTL